jgi:hypothetical protein
VVERAHDAATGPEDDHHEIAVPRPRGGVLTNDPLAQQPATELPEAVEAQIRETREVLHADAAVAGVDPQEVDAAVDAAAARYRDVRVHAFIGILVEREVRSALDLRTPDSTELDRQAGPGELSVNP